VAIFARPSLLPQLACSADAPSGTGARATDADRTHLAALYAEHGARIHRFVRDLLGDATLAGDATQETFIRASKKLALLDPTMKVAPWLFGIARNVSLELRKARLRAGRYIVASSEEHIADAAAPGCLEREYLGREALRIVGAALAELSEERRAMLLLRLDHGQSYEDIALSMGCSLARVKIEIFRAREVLREAMTKYEGTPDRRPR